MPPCSMLSSQSSQSLSPSPAFSSLCALTSLRSAFFQALVVAGLPTRILLRPCDYDLTRRDSFVYPEGSRRATNSFTIRTYKKAASNPFGIRSFKTQDLKPFGMCSYKKPGVGGGVPLRVHPEQQMAAHHTSLSTTHYPLLTIHCRPETMSAHNRQTTQRASVPGRSLNGRNA